MGIHGNQCLPLLRLSFDKLIQDRLISHRYQVLENTSLYNSDVSRRMLCDESRDSGTSRLFFSDFPLTRTGLSDFFLLKLYKQHHNPIAKERDLLFDLTYVNPKPLRIFLLFSLIHRQYRVFPQS